VLLLLSSSHRQRRRYASKENITTEQQGRRRHGFDVLSFLSLSEKRVCYEEFVVRWGKSDANSLIHFHTI
jgi:hypothetical protein